MSDCLFCKIIAWEIPSHKLYEDADTFVFLDIHPVSRGHLLVIPKRHCVNVFDIKPDDLKKVMVVAQRFAQLAIERLDATGVNIVNASGEDAQQSVGHLHFHVVPRYPIDGIDLWFHGSDSSDLVAVKNKLI